MSKPLLNHSKELHGSDLASDRYGGLPEYIPLFYSLDDTAANFGIDTIESYDSEETVNFTLSIEKINSTGQNAIINIDFVPLYHVRKLPMQNAAGCHRHGGEFESHQHRCFIYSVISKLCLKVGLNPEQISWRSNATNKTLGCLGRDLRIAEYQHIKLGAGQAIEHVFPYTVDRMEVQVRSKYDPSLAVIEITDHTLDFGMKAGDLKLLGFILFFCFIGMTI